MSRLRLPRPSPRRRPGPRGRAGRLSGRPSFRPARPAFPSGPRALGSRSRFPAAAPPLPPGPSSPAARLPREAQGRGRRLRLLTSSRGRAGGRSCVPRRRATFTRARESEGRGGEPGGGGWGGGRCCLPGSAAAASAGSRGRGGGCARRLGAGRPPAGAPPPPTAGPRRASPSPRAGAGRPTAAAAARGPGAAEALLEGRGLSPPSSARVPPVPPQVGDAEVPPAAPRQPGRRRAPAGPRRAAGVSWKVCSGGSGPSPGRRGGCGYPRRTPRLPLMARAARPNPQRSARPLPTPALAPRCPRREPLGSSRSQPHPGGRAGRQSCRWAGEDGPRNCLGVGSAFVRRNPGRTPEATRASTAGGVGGAVAGLRRPPSLSLGSVGVYCRETLQLSVNTYGRKRLHRNIAVFAVPAGNRFPEKSASFHPEEEERPSSGTPPPPAPSLCGT